MKKWFRFFSLSFFSHSISKEAARRGYTNVFLGFVMALALLWSALVGGHMLPFGAHYKSSPDFKATAYAVLANADGDKRIDAEILNGNLKLKRHGGEYAEGVLINTLESESDRQTYSVGGYEVIVDSRPADTVAEVEAYCLANDGTGKEISYEDYLTLSEVARLNFDFKIRYTKNALVLDDESVAAYKTYVDGLGAESKAATEKLASELLSGSITKAEYQRGIYELYFTSYYPAITAYESTSKLPLLRNYYYHEYISKGLSNYLFIFDDYMTGSFCTSGGIDVSFYGFYSGLENGQVVAENADAAQAKRLVDGFIKASFDANLILNAYAYLTNTVSIMPVLALMLMVAALLAHSILRLRGAEGIRTLGATFKIIGSFSWFSGVAAAALSIILSFLVNRNFIGVLPPALFFAVLVVRTVIFIIKEDKLHKEQLERQKSEQTEA